MYTYTLDSHDLKSFAITITNRTLTIELAVVKMMITLGRSLGSLGRSWSSSWPLLSSPRAPFIGLEALKDTLHGTGIAFSWALLAALGAFPCTLGTALCPSWGALGRSWEALEGVLGHSWPYLECSWPLLACPGMLLGALEALKKGPKPICT